MTTVGAALVTLLMVAVGLVMFHRVARLLCANAALPPEGDLLLLGILPGLALVGGVVTLLAALHLFRLWVILALVAATIVMLRQDVRAVLAGMGRVTRAGLANIRQGDLFPLIAFGYGLAILFLGLRLGTIPADNNDIWVFHIPLAQSYIAHHGFIANQLPNMLFYGNQPSLFELLFATAMLKVPNFVAANAVNLAISFGFVLLLLSFARQRRDIQFLMMCYIFFQWENFLLGAAQPMTDMPRACFSAAAYLFAYRYAREPSRFDLTICALLAGGAVAGKYTELVTPIFIGIVLLPIIARHKTWRHLVPAAIAFTAVAFIWYLKNLILVGNPLYPFLFGHRGLSDQWLAGYMQDIGTPFNVADRGYSTNLLSLKGWQDFGAVLFHYFRSLAPFALVALIGLVLRRRRFWVLPLWCAILFVFWYAVMFNGTRWAVSAILLLLATAFISLFAIADRLLAAWNPLWPTMVLEAIARWLRGFRRPWTVLASIAVAGFAVFGLVQLKQGYGHSFLPPWMDRELASALIKPGRMDDYLSAHKPGYKLYRYIGENNMSPVLVPFDSGAIYSVSSDNGGHPNEWIWPSHVLPSKYEDIVPFVHGNKLGYFIDQPELDATKIERLGADHVAMARAVIAYLKPRSQLILADGHGMYLYKVLPSQSGP